MTFYKSREDSWKKGKGTKKVAKGDIKAKGGFSQKLQRVNEYPPFNYPGQFCCPNGPQ